MVDRQWTERSNAPEDGKRHRCNQALAASGPHLGRLPVQGGRRRAGSARPVRRPPPAHRLSLHVRHRLGSGLRRLLLGHRRYVPLGPPSCPGRVPDAGLTSTDRDTAGLSTPHGLDRSLVLVGWLRLQRSDGCDDRRGRARWSQRLSTERRRDLPDLPHNGAWHRHLGSHWTYLDLAPFGRQETWEPCLPTCAATRRRSFGDSDRLGVARLRKPPPSSCATSTGSKVPEQCLTIG